MSLGQNCKILDCAFQIESVNVSFQRQKNAFVELGLSAEPSPLPCLSVSSQPQKKLQGCAVGCAAVRSCLRMLRKEERFVSAV